MNKINSQCPVCECKTALVRGIAGFNDKLLVVVKCTDKNHQYQLDCYGTNQEWAKFFEDDIVKILEEHHKRTPVPSDVTPK